MFDSQFIGRGENLVKSILQGPLLSHQQLQSQIKLEDLIPHEIFYALNEEVQKHTFDFVMRRRDGDLIVIEVNYKHGNKAAQKANDIFIPLLKDQGIKYVTIDDWDSRSLFKETKNGYHKRNWNDYRDIIDALEKGGIEP